MSWPASFGVALLAAVLGCVGSGFVASLCVDWYRITSREGASGYFIISIGLLGLLAGFVLGLVTARSMAGSGHPGFLAGLGAALGLELALLAATAGVARVLADVPPTAGGEGLWILVEVSAPGGTPLPATLDIGSLSGRTLRIEKQGALFPEDAREEGGRRILPGIAPLFTTRGTPILTFGLAPGQAQGFILPRWPRRPAAWSDWLPRARPGAATPATPLTYRYRVARRSEPVRSRTFGPFTVSTSVDALNPRDEAGRCGAWSHFGVSHAGKPVALGEVTVDAVAALPGPRAALLLHLQRNGPEEFVLLVDEGGALRQEPVTEASKESVRLVTNDVGLFAAPHPGSTGWFDRDLLAREGPYLVGSDALLDTRGPAVHRFRVSPDVTLDTGCPPLGVSPDGRSLLRFGWRGGDSSQPVLDAIDTLSGKNDLLPIDRARMRYTNTGQIDPAWVAHHFEWVRKDDGVDRLAERGSFRPLPYHGEIQLHEKDRPVYWIDGAAEPLRAALLAFLAAELRAETLPAAPDAYEQPVRIAGKVVNVAAASGASTYVAVSMAREEKDSALVAEIAKRFDAELATGRYDGLFSR